MPRTVVIDGKQCRLAEGVNTASLTKFDAITGVQTQINYRFPEGNGLVLVSIYEKEGTGHGAPWRLKSQEAQPMQQFLPPKPPKSRSWAPIFSSKNYQRSPKAPSKDGLKSEEKMQYQDLYGVRISAQDPDRIGEFLTGTVLSSPANPSPQDKIFLFLDRFDNRFQWDSLLIGAGRGALLSQPAFQFPGISGDVQSYAEAPHYLGVVVTSDFMQDGVRFRKGAFGRVISRTFGRDREKTMFWTVSWIRPKCPNFRSIMVSDVLFHNCWTIHASKPLAWCILASNHSGVLRIFLRPGHFQSNKFKKGDYVVYCSDKPHRATANGARDVVYAITRGTVLRVNGTDAEGCCLRVSLAGGCAPEVLGAPLTVKPNTVQSLEAPYLQLTDKVTVEAEVTFRKRNLQGLAGQVLLPTDQDGDVGVEFLEDIGAGSLDGLGKEGQCLYIPASALKKASE